MVSRRSLVGSSAPLLIDPMLRASGYASERVARADKRRRHRRGGDNDNLEDTGDEVLEELPEATEEHIGKRKQVRGEDGKRDRSVTARETPSGEVVWTESHFPSGLTGGSPFIDEFWNAKGWFVSGTGSAAPVQGGANHPGTIRLSTGATNGNTVRIHQGDNATDLLIADDVFEALWAVKVVSAAYSNVVFRVGFSTDWSANPSNDWFGFQFDPAVASTWYYTYRVGGVSALSTSSVVAVNSDWHILSLRQVGNIFYYSVDGIAETSYDSGGSTYAHQAGVYARTAENVTKQIDVDLYVFNPIEVVR